jgi:hypothetical protein
MTLVEFLLARIDEDYERATSGWGRVEPGRWMRLDEGQSILTPAAVLADCEAKRRIVNAWRSGFPDEDRYSTGWHDFHVHALCLLALPYADHPDYDEAWRP